MQLAHPLIAAGVANHSSFRGGLRSGVKRLASTVRAMLALSFGSEDEAIEAAAGINCIHDRISGELGEPAGAFSASSRYSAHDPELLRWVHATLLDSILLTYEQLVAPLTADQRDRYCAEAAIMEPLLDIPAGQLPRDLAALQAYVAQTVANGNLAVSDRSRGLARAILFPPGWRLLWPIFRPVQLLTIGLLPRAIREGYGFAWTARDARSLARWISTLRRLRRVTPRFMREWPASRRRHLAHTRKPHPLFIEG